MEQFNENKNINDMNIAENETEDPKVVTNASKSKNIIKIAVVVIIAIIAAAAYFIISKPKNIEIPERYLEAIEGYKNSLKDPASMRIYGDILVIQMEDTDDSVAISVVCDAKNGFGGYTGKEDIVIYLVKDLDPVYANESSQYYIDFRDGYEKLSKTDPREGISFEIFDGEAVAELLNVSYYDV